MMSENAPDNSAQLLVNVQGHVATVTLNRPAKLNALTKTMWQGLGDAFREFNARDELRCIVIRGAEERAFSPGNDIAEFANERANREQAIAYGKIMHATAQAIDDCVVPVVARIHGICVGGGLEIAALADLRICGVSSRFGAPIKNLGLVMAYPEMAPLIRLVGEARTLELLLEGTIIDAQQALAIGLVSRVVADEQVEQEVHTTVQRICSGAPLAARWHKKFARRLRHPGPGRETSLTEQESLEAFDCFDTEDFRIGYQSFLAKVPPTFVGR